MPDRHALLLEDAVIVVDPLLGFAGIDEGKGQRPDAQPRRQLDGLAVGASDPERRMRPLHRLGHDVAAGHLEILALEAGIGIHRHHIGALLDCFGPLAAFLLERHAIAAEFEQGRRLAGAPLDPAVGHQIERRDPFGDARRMVVVRRHQRDAVAEADVLGPLRAGGEEHFRRRGMRILLQEVVLDLPGIVDAELVGEFDLVECVLEQLELVAVVPRPRQLMLVEDAETHGGSPRQLAFGVAAIAARCAMRRCCSSGSQAWRGPVVMPPSTTMWVPVTNSESSDAK